MKRKRYIYFVSYLQFTVVIFKEADACMKNINVISSVFDSFKFDFLSKSQK